jgi:hypothetical protein
MACAFCCAVVAPRCRPGSVAVLDAIDVGAGGSGVAGTDRAGGLGWGVEHGDRRAAGIDEADGGDVAGPVCRARFGRACRSPASRSAAGGGSAGGGGPDDGGSAEAPWRHALVFAAVGHGDGDLQCGCRQHLARAPVAALAYRDVQVLRRSGVGCEGPGRGRALPRSAGEGGGGVRGREEPDPGVGPDRADAADRPGPARAAHPRLQAGRHDHVVRRAGGRHGEDHRGRLL